MRNTLVIDFGGTLAKYSIMDEEGLILLKGEESAPLSSRESFLHFLEGLYRQHAEEYALRGVAISMPGVIDERRSYVYTAGSYLPLYDMDLCVEVKDRIPVPVSVENDGKCGALAEVWKGNLADNDDGVVIILGTGVAGGIIKGRKLHKGKSLSAGEFSYVLLGEGTDFTSATVWRCSMSFLLFETAKQLGIDVRKLANYPLVSQVADCSQTLSAFNDLPEYQTGLDGYQFFELLEQGNEIVQVQYEHFTASLAKLCWNLQAIYGPEKILFGGGVTRQSRLIPDIRAQYDKIAAQYAMLMQFPCVIERCRFGNEANQYGALYHHLQILG